MTPVLAVLAALTAVRVIAVPPPRAPPSTESSPPHGTATGTATASEE